MNVLDKGQLAGLTENSIQPAGSREFYIGAAWEGRAELDFAVQPVRNDIISTDDMLYTNRLEVFGGALQMSGVALIADDSAVDNKAALIKTDAVPGGITALVAGVIAFYDDELSAVSNTRLTIRDGDSVEAPPLYTLPLIIEKGTCATVLVSCVLLRGSDNSWSIKNTSDFRNEFGKGVEALSGFAGLAPSYAQAA